MEPQERVTSWKWLVLLDTLPRRSLRGVLCVHVNHGFFFFIVIVFMGLKNSVEFLQMRKLGSVTVSS